MFCRRAVRLASLKFIFSITRNNIVTNRKLCSNNMYWSSSRLFSSQKFDFLKLGGKRSTNQNFHSNLQSSLFLLSFSGLLSFLNKEDDKESELITTIKRGILLIQKEELQAAEQMLHLALRLAQEQQNSDGLTYVYDLLANVAFERHQFSKAEQLFVNVMQRELAKGTANDDPKIVHMSLKLAKIYEETGQIDKAEQGFKFCLECLQPLVDKSSDEDLLTLWAMSLDWYARFLQQQNRLDEALVHYKKAYAMCVKVNGEVHEESVVLLNDIGTISYLKGDKDEALAYMTKAIEVGKHLPNMEDFSSVYVNLGNIYLKKGLYEEAKKFCSEGYKNAKRHHNPEGLKEAEICLEEIKKIFKK
ncbi:tetratricopeptide repeat protein 19 homolog, mitochondrial isoform X2 [Nilaparvata lugens]|uniref:tetratricopeptide repeat protein 19 homolog, mitochondrial isoform X2 n=1 Tax=Nilaparvata lugens TaxID=108931 RepID=UPI00193E52FC|nr:tetratricopeptide repeat protein 19 homolog, mitochondrial isoform X2 [Nilaparvata lugens]